MKKRGIPGSYFADSATLEAKRQHESSAREKRYLSREKQKAIALMRKRRRVRLALEGFVDVFKVLPRNDLNSLEISCSTFHSIVNIHMDSVCLFAINYVRVEHRLGTIALNGAEKFRAIDEGQTDAAPVGQNHFRENVYVLLQRVVSKCVVRKMRINELTHLDDVAFRALIAIQPNVDSILFGGAYNMHSIADNVALDLVCSALFGFASVTFIEFRAPYEVFIGHAVKRTKSCVPRNLVLCAPVDQDRYHDEDLISLLSTKSGNTYNSIRFQGLRLSSEFFLRIIEAHTTNALSTICCSIDDSKVDEQKLGTHSFAEIESAFGRTAELVLRLQNLPRLRIEIDMITYNITIFRSS